MTSSAECWRRRLVVLAVAPIWLATCATGGSELAAAAVCPPVVEYRAGVQTRAAEELERLPQGSASAVMREQPRASE